MAWPPKSLMLVLNVTVNSQFCGSVWPGLSGMRNSVASPEVGTISSKRSSMDTKAGSIELFFMMSTPDARLTVVSSICSLKVTYRFWLMKTLSFSLRGVVLWTQGRGSNTALITRPGAFFVTVAFVWREVTDSNVISPEPPTCSQRRKTYSALGKAEMPKGMPTLHWKSPYDGLMSPIDRDSSEIVTVSVSAFASLTSSLMSPLRSSPVKRAGQEARTNMAMRPSPETRMRRRRSFGAEPRFVVWFMSFSCRAPSPARRIRMKGRGFRALIV